MRRLLIVSPLFLVLAAGCDATRRDWTYCDQKYHDCLKGFTCDLTQERCVPESDGGTIDTNRTDVPPAVDLGSDAKDAPIGIDGAVVDSSIVDVSIVDAGPPIDLAKPDSRVPDAAGTCSTDNDCVGISAGAHCAANKTCVACTSSSHCSGNTPFCSAQNTCVSCALSGTVDGGANAVCSGSTPVCNATGGSCVECVKASDCPSAGKAFCVQNRCVGCDSPGAGASGSVDGGVRDAGAGGNGCTGTSKPVCVPSNGNHVKAGQCVGCASNSDCPGNTPICDTTTTFTCQACTSDSQCTTGPGVCMFHQGGRCATDAETLYVKNSASCTGGSGTAASPFCDSQAAISAVTGSKRVIVMRGPSSDGLSAISSTPSGAQISIIGQNGAATAAGASVAIQVTAGDVYVRGLSIVNGNKAGITVESGATLRMDRCTVTSNKGGGVLVKAGANFDIANSIFENNGPGLASTTTTFGGVFLGGSAPSSGPSRFWFNTIVNNQDRGVICADTTQALTGMLLYGNMNGDFLTCVIDGSSKFSSGSPIPDGLSNDSTNPALDVNNRLTATSRCRDFVAATVVHPVDDVDGEARPKGAKLDCGADEF